MVSNKLHYNFIHWASFPLSLSLSLSLSNFFILRVSIENHLHGQKLGQSSEKCICNALLDDLWFVCIILDVEFLYCSMSLKLYSTNGDQKDIIDYLDYSSRSFLLWHMSCTVVPASYANDNYAGFTWLELSPLTGRKHQVWIRTKCFTIECVFVSLVSDSVFSLHKSFFSLMGNTAPSTLCWGIGNTDSWRP